MTDELQKLQGQEQGASTMTIVIVSIVCLVIGGVVGFFLRELVEILA